MARRTKSSLFDEQVIVRLEAAAKHAGFKSTAAMCEAVVSSGLIAKSHQAHDILEERSLGEVGKFLAQRMEVQTDQAKWFDGLHKTQKGALVCALMNKGHSPPAIAVALNITETVVRDTWAAYADELGKTVTGIRASTVVGELTARRDELYEQAVQRGQLALAWRIQKDYTASLQDFGIIERAVFRQEVTHTLSLDEAAQTELDAILSVREKKRLAQQEVKKLSLTGSGPEATQEGEGGKDVVVAP
jgi:hypothetical protein